MPFLVTDPSKLQVICPESARRYADRVDNNVPIFKERITIAGRRASRAVPAKSAAEPTSEQSKRSASGPRSSQASGSTDAAPVSRPPQDDDDGVMDIPTVPMADGVASAYGFEGCIRMRSMSRAALKQEKRSPLHICGHYPHNPQCEVCNIAHLKHAPYKKKYAAYRPTRCLSLMGQVSLSPRTP